MREASTTGRNTGGPLLGQVLCDTGFGELPGRPANTPSRTDVVMHKLPKPAHHAQPLPGRAGQRLVSVVDSRRAARRPRCPAGSGPGRPAGTAHRVTARPVVALLVAAALAPVARPGAAGGRRRRTTAPGGARDQRPAALAAPGMAGRRRHQRLQRQTVGARSPSAGIGADLGRCGARSAAGRRGRRQGRRAGRPGPLRRAAAFVVGPGPSAGSAMDGLADDVPAGQQFTGLHLVGAGPLGRRRTPPRPCRRSLALVPGGPSSDASSRLQASPEAIVTDGRRRSSAG